MSCLRRQGRALSPTLGIILLLVVTVLMTAAAATLVFDFAPGKAEEEVTGVEVTFTEDDDYGSVTARLVEKGTADTVYVNTSSNGYEFTGVGDEHKVSPDEGPITIIAMADGNRVVAQTYSPEHAPDERLVADPGPLQQQAPGSTYTFDGDDSVGDIAEYRWDFDGDGQTDATGENVSTTFDEPGVHEVTLTVESTNGVTHANTTTVRNAHLVVDHDGTGDYDEIQPAVDNASSGWTVLVAGDHYEERVTVSVSDLTIITQSTPTIDGSNVSAGTGFDITASGVEVDGLRFTDFEGDAAIRVDAPDTTLTDVFVGHSGDDETTGAIVATRSADGLHIGESRIAANDGCGVVIGDNSDTQGGPNDVAVEGSRIHSGTDYGVCAYATSSNVTVADSDILNNDAGGLLAYGTEDFIVRDSAVDRNGVGQSEGVGGIHAYEVDGITIEQSTISKNFRQGISLNDVRNVSVHNSSISENRRVALAARGKEENNALSNQLSDVSVSIQGVSDLQVYDSNLSRNYHQAITLNQSDDIFFDNTTLEFNGNTSDTSTSGVLIQNKGSDEARNVTIVNSSLLGSGEADIYVESQTENVTATENWWGNDTGPNSDQYVGPVTVDPYCTTEDCSN